MNVKEIIKEYADREDIYPAMDIRDIVRAWLELNEFDGLCFPGECGCEINDLAPCDSMNGDCIPARQRFCKDCKVKECEHRGEPAMEWCMVAEEGA